MSLILLKCFVALVGFHNLPRCFTRSDVEQVKIVYVVCLAYSMKWTYDTNLFLAIGRDNLALRLKRLGVNFSHRSKSFHNEMPLCGKRLVGTQPKQLRECYEVIHSFEAKMFYLANMECYRCHGVHLDYKHNRKKYIFGNCKTSRSKKQEQYQAPTLVDDSGGERFDIPMELQDLRLGEQLLIQKYSPFVPVVHIQKSVFLDSRALYFISTRHCFSLH